ncbi:MAG: YciI family protein [Pseudomonas sp.]
MLDDPTDPVANDGERWGAYLAGLRQSGHFDGGSSIGAGERCRKGQAPQPVNDGLTGFIRVRAESLEEARRFLAGNPHYEAGGSVEVRELPRD